MRFTTRIVPGARAWVTGLLAIAAAGTVVPLLAAGGTGDRSTGAARGPAMNETKAGHGAGVAAAAAPKPGVRYARDIRPILSDRCFTCHGPDATKRAADLRLDVREIATGARKHGPAIVPGDPEHSLLWKKVNAGHDEMMPPADSPKRPLSAEEKELVRQWIADGAVYEPHWAFVPPVKSPVPSVKDEAWCRNDIDRFVRARQEEEGITPAKRAEPALLLRRVFEDLTGLPPTVAELDEFLKDPSPAAYDKWVDKLLNEEPYRTRMAERMAAPWLDGARYADTSGIHMDAGRQVWLYREWVIKAYRDNMPFDRFLTEQIAGDLMANATDDDKIASGFNRNHVTTDEGGAIAEEYLVEYAVDRTATTGSVFLGLTLGCARCHDHKFDPTTAEDFYKFYAYFDSIEEPGLYSQTPNPNRAHEPFIVVPTPEQAAQAKVMDAELASLKKQQDDVSPEEQQQRDAYFAQLPTKAGVVWAKTTTSAAKSDGGAMMTIRPDGSVLASGANPATDVHEYVIKAQGSPETDKAGGLRLLLVEALADRSLGDGRVGRVANGNAVLSGVDLNVVGKDGADGEKIGFMWAWANVEQSNGDFDATAALAGGEDRGWAVAGYMAKGGRVLVLMTDKPVPAGTDVRVKLRYESKYAQHVLGRVRLTLGAIGDAAQLPTAAGRWREAGPFLGTTYEQEAGPEKETSLNLAATFAPGPGEPAPDANTNVAQRSAADAAKKPPMKLSWRFDEKLIDGPVVMLNEGVGATYLARTVYSPVARTVEVSLGSDDGFRLYVNGAEVAGKKIDRGATPDSDKASVPLKAGANFLVLKIVNTGGPSAYAFRVVQPEGTVPANVLAALLPERARNILRGEAKKMETAWRQLYSPGFLKRQKDLESLTKARAELDEKMPRTMVMKELDKPRETFVLTRGQYDHPDHARPVTRGVPAFLGKLPEGAPANRLGLAEWMTSPANPLVARVAVNRLWEQMFGTGIVKTSEDFGLQGEWPSHPELLDWLAVDFREHGWDLRRMLRMIVTSETYCQDSAIRPDMKAKDPENRLLWAYPRRRMSAEQVRDEALFVSGLLVEKLGGPSVKPYQPAGLWQEVAMPQSNTRIFVQGTGEDLYRRSLYTYWKRAAPPPSLLTFDAPTREFCVIRRPTTSTPLQALVLWNDPQYVEAARVLAQRVLKGDGDDGAKIATLWRMCTSVAPSEAETKRVAKALAEFRERYKAAPEDAAKLVHVGESKVPEKTDEPELAAWTMIASSIQNLYRTTTQE